MKKLIAVGYWYNKLGEEEDRFFICPQELVKDNISDDMLKLSSYIANGKSARQAWGYSKCRICGEKLGTLCLTDDVYIWPEKLEHYILKHKIYLPDDFINHAKENNWKVKETNYQGMYRGEVDFNYWIRWGKSHKKRCDNILIKSFQKLLELIK